VKDCPTYQWNIVSATINENTGMIVEEICRHQPDIVSATCWLFNHESLMHIVSRVKALLPHVCIILGGPEFLGNNKGFLDARPYVTAVFKGEGEEMFPAFVKSLLLDNNKWKEIPGWEYIENGEYHSSREEVIKDFASLNTPEESELFSWDKSFVQLETSRGCFNSCKFCVSGISKAPVQDLPISSIQNRLDTIVSKGIKEVRILDRTFNANPKRAKEFIDLAATYKSKLKFHLEIHPALIRGEFKQVLESVPENLLHVEAGIQSLQENVLLAFGLWLIPVISAALSIFSMVLNNKINAYVTGSEKKSNDPTQRSMMIMMPLMSLWICFTLPAALGLYWIYSSLSAMLSEFANIPFLRKFMKTEAEKKVRRAEELKEMERLERERKSAAKKKAQEENRRIQMERKLNKNVSTASREGLRTYARGRTYDPDRYPTFPYEDPNKVLQKKREEMAAAAEAKQAKKGGKKDKAAVAAAPVVEETVETVTPVETAPVDTTPVHTEPAAEVEEGFVEESFLEENEEA
jgi:hypothetical protein